MISFSKCSKRLVALPLQSRTASSFCGMLLLTANAAFADANSAPDKLMSDAIAQSQRMVSLMTQNCSGGRNGTNPLAYGAFVASGNQVEQKLVDLRVALAKGQTANAGPEIDTVVGLLEKMVGMMHGNCPGGAHGQDPLNYGELVNIKNRMQGKLDALKTLLTN